MLKVRTKDDWILDVNESINLPFCLHEPMLSMAMSRVKKVVDDMISPVLVHPTMAYVGKRIAAYDSKRRKERLAEEREARRKSLFTDHEGGVDFRERLRINEDDPVEGVGKKGIQILRSFLVIAEFEAIDFVAENYGPISSPCFFREPNRRLTFFL